MASLAGWMRDETAPLLVEFLMATTHFFLMRLSLYNKGKTFLM